MPTYGLVMHHVPTSTFNPSRVEDMRQKLVEDNSVQRKDLHKGASIQMGWLSKSGS